MTTFSHKPIPKQVPVLGGPSVILVEPQLGENIGTAARAMLNFGLTDLRIVNPRDGWPSEKAQTSSSGADLVIDNVRVFETTEEAVADLKFLYATTARPRDMFKREATAREAAFEMREAIDASDKVGILFGAERHGLSNADVTLAQTVIAIPVNPAYASLNLAQAVLLVAYEWFQSGTHQHADGNAGGRARLGSKTEPMASNQDLVHLFEHLEGELDAAGFLRPPEKRPNMVKNLRNIFQKAQLREQEVRTLRGVIKSLTVFARQKALDEFNKKNK
ncbi:MAG: RNA methyltransferase [Alphaproteobacteria bacterium]|jgi:tRNA/rRNA methyltransferase|nr:RNA methyltransferase [Alphaproteobacteria bacterium]MBT4086468.1 RNA methyltransferase [Alphaproteobacteria bacterium]MBT4546448.1 RNA methyltransferase [Alphaproteobacteria bacterium]